MDNEYRDNLMHGVNINTLLNNDVVGRFNTLPYGISVCNVPSPNKSSRETKEGIISDRVYDILLSSVTAGYTTNHSKKSSKKNKTRKK
jgi:uncharacterized protein (DUF1919 family)